MYVRSEKEEGRKIREKEDRRGRGEKWKNGTKVDSFAPWLNVSSIEVKGSH